MTPRQKLPIGIQSFSKLREGGYYYVDKTAYAWELSQQSGYFFISRPRRFGKSLFLDTLKELFEGNEALFRGLFIHDRWDWSRRHPVIRLSFGDGVVHSRAELDQRIRHMLQDHRARLQITGARDSDIAGEFSDLIRLAHQQHGERVVVLIDEYDKPILDNLTDPPAAEALRDGLKNLYSVLKDADPHLRFCLLTGVSKFSKVSLFSGLNNLSDITLDQEYSALCGYTDNDIDTTFAPELPGLDREQIRHWYNGYTWGGESVYNPFDALLLFQKRTFAPYWFESATPTFLVKVLTERDFSTPQLERLQTSAALLGQFDVQAIATEALLFQTGYLTIRRVDEPLSGLRVFTLDYPNHEVKTSLNEALLPALGLPAQQALHTGLQVLKALRANDFNALEAHFKALYASLPHDWYRKNPIAQYEGHYASIFYSHLAALGLNLTVEDATHKGQCGEVLDFNGHIYLFEFKVVEQVPEGRALAQLRARDYAAKHRASGKPIHLIGVEFSREQRQIVAFEVAIA